MAEKSKTTVLFKFEGIIKAELEVEEPNEIDNLAWIEFGKIVSGMPKEVGISKSEIGYISPDILSDAKEAIKEFTKTGEEPTGQYL